jgi:hypothetical protein
MTLFQVQAPYQAPWMKRNAGSALLLKVGSLDAYGDVNVLTADIGTSKLAQGNCGHTCLAQVEKFKGAPPRVKAFLGPRVS